MKILKVVFTLVFILAIIMAAGLVFLIYTFDANHYKEQIVSVVKKQTGRNLVIDGDLKLSVFPDIAIALGKTSLSNTKGFADAYFADITSGEISVKVMPLLKKKVELDEIRLQDLTLNLQRKVDGSTNWDDLLKKDEKPVDAEQPNEIVQEMLDNLSIAGVSLQNAHIRWRDEQTKQDITLFPVNLKTGVFKSNSPLPVELALTLKQKRPEMILDVKGVTTVVLGKDKQTFRLNALKLDMMLKGGVVAHGHLQALLQGDVKADPQSISVEKFIVKTKLVNGFIPKNQAEATLEGPMSFDLNTQILSMPKMSIQTKIEGDGVPEGKAIVKLQSALLLDRKTQKLSLSGLRIVSDIDGKMLDGGVLHSLIVSKNIFFNLESQKLMVSGIDMEADIKGGIFKKGDATVHFVSSNMQFDVTKQKLVLQKLKLDTQTRGELLQGAAATMLIMSDETIVNFADTRVRMPTLSFDTVIKGGPVPSGQLTQQAKGRVDLNWGKKTGDVMLPSLSLAMANLKLKGSNVRLQPLIKYPSIAGQFQTNSFNLKQVLKMLGIDPPVTAKPEALTNVQARFNLRADTQKVVLNGLQMKLDNSTVSGNFSLSDFTQPAIVTTLKINRLILDDYLASASDNQTVKATTSTAKAVNRSKEEELLPLDSLKVLNLQAALTVNSLRINKLKLSNIHTNIKAKNGLVQLNPANAKLYKGTYKGSIIVDVRRAIPTMKMHHELINVRSEGLLFDLFADRYLSGSAKLITDFSSNGNTMTRLLKNLNGKTKMNFKDGHIRDSKLAEQVALAVKLFEKKEIKGDKTIVTFTGLSGDWDTKKGVFNTNNLKLLSPYFTISGVGKADVVEQQLDMKVRISQAGNEKIFAPLHIFGSFSDPKFKLDLQELIASLAKEDLEKAKKDAKERLKQAEDEAREKLKQRLDAEKQRAMDRLKEKLGEQATEEIQKQLKDNVEEQIKDKLKESLRSWF